MAQTPSPRKPMELLPPDRRIVPQNAIKICEERRHVKVHESSGYIIGLDIQYTSALTGETRWVPDYPPARFESRPTLTYLGFSAPMSKTLWMDYQDGLQYERRGRGYNLCIFLNQFVEGQVRAQGWKNIHFDHAQAPYILAALGLSDGFRDWVVQRHLGSQIGREPRRTLEQHILRYMRWKVEMLRRMDELVTGRTMMVAEATYFYEGLEGEGLWSKAWMTQLRS